MPKQRDAGLELEADILAYIDEGMGSVGEPPDDERFEALALDVFRYQFEQNEAYGAWCRQQGKTPDQIDSWQEIPAVPSDIFKELPLTCFPAEEAERVYLTSGTTISGRNGRHYIRSLRLYQASLRPNFHAHLLPDLGHEERMTMLRLFPDKDVLPNSSLGDMLEDVTQQWGTPQSGVFMDDQGLRMDALKVALDDAVTSNRPVALLGTAFSFVHLLDHLADTNQKFHLPAGSRIMDTGGFKGRSREVSRGELFRLYEEFLGVGPDHVVNEYGMTELGSQFYDTVLRESLAGRSDAVARRRKLPPPWARVMAVDPETLLPVAPGTIGCLRLFDLSNLHSVMAVQTSDLGIARDDGFEVIGRASGAEARGCSLAVDELMQTVTRRGQHPEQGVWSYDVD